MSKFKLPTKHEIKTFVEKHKAEIATVGAVTALTVIYAVTPRNAQTPVVPTTPTTRNTPKAQEWVDYQGISDCGMGMVIITGDGSDKLQRGGSLHVQTDNPDLAVLITEAPKTEAPTATE